MFRKAGTAPRELERGQVLALFAILVTGMLMLAALVFDGASSLVRRRQLQDAADSAALAAANQMSTYGCSSSVGGTPHPAVSSAATASVSNNLSGFSASNIAINCLSDWPNTAVRVTLTDSVAALFGSVLGRGSTAVTVTSAAVNGQQSASSDRYQLVLLDEYDPADRHSDACPALKVNGNDSTIRLTLEGDMAINSTCPASEGGAVTSGGSNIAFNNGARLLVAGDVVPARHIPISPQILTHQPPVADPLAMVPEPDRSQLVVRSTSQYTVGGTEVLQPGVYVGGIKVHKTALLLPGIYYLDGGGLSTTGSAQIFSVNPGVTSTSVATWSTDCTAGSCGVLIFVKPNQSSDSLQMRGTAHLRPFNPSAVTGYAPSDFESIGYWQSATPTPQGDIDIGGSGAWYMTGAFYAPSAVLGFGGSSDSGLSDNFEMVSQIIVKALDIGGSSTVTIRYGVGIEAAGIPDYGLIE